MLTFAALSLAAAILLRLLSRSVRTDARFGASGLRDLGDDQLTQHVALRIARHFVEAMNEVLDVVVDDEAVHGDAPPCAIAGVSADRGDRATLRRARQRTVR